MKPYLFPALLIALVLIVALLSLAVTPGDGARALVEPTNPHISSLQAQEAAPIETVRPSAAPTQSSSQAVGSDEPSARPTSTPRHSVGSPLLAGWASWYQDPRNPTGIYGAAGPDLRRALGAGWRGRQIVVTGFPGGQAHSVTLTLSDWCLCLGGRQPRLVDLSAAAFQRACGALSLGTCRIEVQWAVQ